MVTLCAGLALSLLIESSVLGARSALHTYHGIGVSIYMHHSMTAELLAGAQTLSLADRHHFDLNLSDLLDKSTQCKMN